MLRLNLAVTYWLSYVETVDLSDKDYVRTMDVLRQQLGQKIREARKAKGLTLEELAVKIGTSKSVLSRYEGGKINFTVDALQKFATELDASLEINFNMK